MTARSPKFGVSVLGFSVEGAARKRSAATTGARGRRETAPRHARMHVVLIALAIGFHNAASGSMSSFGASNIERSAGLVNEMAIHIYGARAGRVLPPQARTDGFISR
ncbi:MULTISPECIES: hypothetical protein [Bradyrhizobium]|uniref:hypothetical protein n=1 Tax=Bradyrhizobium TaxID=374 RepID=UPI00155E50E6|nr:MULTISPECIES: hypothetical protein [Bradyrhizobium]UUO27582.1 hypothetical protein DCG74_09990 [Bradyrhizobium sp. WBAH42]